jgi:hypothetical protein
MEHTEFRISQVKERLVELALKDGTPKKYAGVMFEAFEIIKQREKALAEATEKLERLNAFIQNWHEEEDA